VIIRGLAEETCLQAAPIHFQPSLVRMLSLGKCLKLTLVSGATALGSAWRASLIYQTDPLPTNENSGHQITGAVNSSAIQIIISSLGK
jgi:hypothetical protein